MNVSNPTPTTGLHGFVDFFECENTDNWSDSQSMLRTIKDQAVLLGFTVLSQTSYDFSPQGSSGVLLLAESHISYHTWPELRKISLDVYSCCKVRNESKILGLLQFFKDTYKPSLKSNFSLVER